jgi:probable rRNA maturation factor
MTGSDAAAVGVEVEVEAPTWAEALPDVEAIARRAASAALGSAGRRGVVVLLTDDETVRDLNARFRGKDAPTNVLAFPAPAGPDAHLGDIALAFGVCAREAGEQDKPLADHLRHLVIHGVLHLLGYDHVTDAQAEAMESLERRTLAGIGVPDPYRAEAGDHVTKDASDHVR